MTSIVLKPWGSYKVLEQGKNYTVKKIIIKPNGKLSLQSHQHRSEHWIVVKGEAEVTLDNKVKILKINENIFIPIKKKHTIANNKEEDLIIIEVWFGDHLDENDIIRYDDIYGRVTK